VKRTCGSHKPSFPVLGSGEKLPAEVLKRWATKAGTAEGGGGEPAPRRGRLGAAEKDRDCESQRRSTRQVGNQGATTGRLRALGESSRG